MQSQHPFRTPDPLPQLDVSKCLHLKGDNAGAFGSTIAFPKLAYLFGAEHTMSRYETAFYRPMLSDWQNHGAWEVAGAHGALECATSLWQQAIKDYEEPALDPAIREELNAYMASRREMIGSGEP